MTTFDDAKQLLADFPRKGAHFNWRENPGPTAALVRLVMQAPKPHEFARRLGAPVLYSSFACGLTADGTAEVARRLHPPRPTREIRAEAADLVVTDATVLAYGSPAHRAALGDLLRGFRIGGAAPSTAEAAAG